MFKIVIFVFLLEKEKFILVIQQEKNMEKEE